MCLGIPAQLVAGDTSHPDLAMAEVGGVRRVINIGLLDEPPHAGDWVLVHMGFALSVMTADEAREALAALGAEYEAEQEAEQEMEQEAARQAAGEIG